MSAVRGGGARLGVCAALSLAAWSSWGGGCEGSRPVVDFTPRFGAERETVYSVSVVNQHDQAVLLAGGQSFASELTLTAAFEVLEARADGTARVRLRLGDVVYRALPGTARAVDFDSARADEANTGGGAVAALRAVSGAAVELEMHARGAVRSVEGLGALHGAMGGDERGAMIAEMFGAEWFRSLAEEVFLAGGESARRRLRESWTASRVVSAPTYPTTTTLLTFTLSGVSAERAEIDVSGSVSVDFSPDTTATEADPKVADQFITQRIAWDRERGRLAESETRQLIEATGEWQEIGFARRYLSARAVRRVSGSGAGAGG